MFLAIGLGIGIGKIALVENWYWNYYWKIPFQYYWYWNCYSKNSFQHYWYWYWIQNFGIDHLWYQEGWKGRGAWEPGSSPLRPFFWNNGNK